MSPVSATYHCDTLYGVTGNPRGANSETILAPAKTLSNPTTNGHRHITRKALAVHIGEVSTRWPVCPIEDKTKVITDFPVVIGASDFGI